MTKDATAIAVADSHSALSTETTEEHREQLEAALKAWLRGKSKHTVRANLSDLRLFASFVRGEKVTDPIDAVLCLIEGGQLAAEASIADWQAEHVERGLQPTSIARRLGTLRSFVATMRRFGLPWDLANVRGPSYSPYSRATGPETDVLESKLDELEARAFDPQGSRSALLDARDYAILVVLYHTAMRRDSLVQLTWANVHLTRRRPYATSIVKGGKTRRFPLSLRCKAALLRWREVRTSHIGKVGPRDHVFCGVGVSTRERGRPLSADAVYKRTKYAHDLSGPHGIRHTAATTVFERSRGNLKLASDMLGHVNAATTQSYMDRQGHSAEEAMRLLSGEEPQT